MKSKVMLALVGPLTLISIALLRRLEIVRPPNNLFSCLRDRGRCLFGCAVLVAHVNHTLFLDTVFWPVLLHFLRRAVQLVGTTLHPTWLRLVLLLVLELGTYSRRFGAAVSY